jgi:hypothetical protein
MRTDNSRTPPSYRVSSFLQLTDRYPQLAVITCLFYTDLKQREKSFSTKPGEKLYSLVELIFISYSTYFGWSYSMNNSTRKRISTCQKKFNKTQLKQTTKTTSKQTGLINIFSCLRAKCKMCLQKPILFRFCDLNQLLKCQYFKMCLQYTLCIMTSQGLMPARNAGLSSHRQGKLNNSKWPLSKFSRAMTTKTSIPRGHQALWRHYA